jgi:hypothetical protein
MACRSQPHRRLRDAGEARMKPYDAKGERRAIKLKRSVRSFGGFWILTDGYRVSVSQQKTGEAPTQHICISRARFNQLIDWYLKDQRT